MNYELQDVEKDLEDSILFKEKAEGEVDLNKQDYEKVATYEKILSQKCKSIGDEKRLLNKEIIECEREKKRIIREINARGDSLSVASSTASNHMDILASSEASTAKKHSGIYAYNEHKQQFAWSCCLEENWDSFGCIDEQSIGMRSALIFKDEEIYKPWTTSNQNREPPIKWKKPAPIAKCPVWPLPNGKEVPFYSRTAEPTNPKKSVHEKTFHPGGKYAKPPQWPPLTGKEPSFASWQPSEPVLINTRINSNSDSSRPRTAHANYTSLGPNRSRPNSGVKSRPMTGKLWGRTVQVGLREDSVSYTSYHEFEATKTKSFNRISGLLNYQNQDRDLDRNSHQHSQVDYSEIKASQSQSPHLPVNKTYISKVLNSPSLLLATRESMLRGPIGMSTMIKEEKLQGRNRLLTVANGPHMTYATYTTSPSSSPYH